MKNYCKCASVFVSSRIHRQAINGVSFFTSTPPPPSTTAAGTILISSTPGLTWPFFLAYVIKGVKVYFHSVPSCQSARATSKNYA